MSKRYECSTCGHRVYLVKGRLCQHDAEGRAFPHRAPVMPTGKRGESLRTRHRARLVRSIASWAARRKCSGSGSEVA